MKCLFSTCLLFTWQAVRWTFNCFPFWIGSGDPHSQGDGSRQDNFYTQLICKVVLLPSSILNVTTTKWTGLKLFSALGSLQLSLLWPVIVLLAMLESVFLHKPWTLVSFLPCRFHICSQRWLLKLPKNLGCFSLSMKNWMKWATLKKHLQICTTNHPHTHNAHQTHQTKHHTYGNVINQVPKYRYHTCKRSR